jgi:hypothetical protein
MMVALFAATTFGDARYFFTDLRSIFSARAIVLPAGDNRKVVKGLLDFSEGSDDGHFESVSALKSLLHIKNYRLRLSKPCGNRRESSTMSSMSKCWCLMCRSGLGLKELMSVTGSCEGSLVF